MSVTYLIKDRVAKFVEYHNGNLFYEVGDFRFPVPVSELQGARVSDEERAAVFLKWITRAHKAISDA